MKIIKESVDEINWRTANSAYHKSYKDNHWVFLLSNEIERFLDKFEEDGELYNVLENSSDMLRSKIHGLMSYMSNFKKYLDRKENQSDSLDAHRNRKFEDEYGMDMSSYQKNINDKYNEIESNYPIGERESQLDKLNSFYDISDEIDGYRYS